MNMETLSELDFAMIADQFTCTDATGAKPMLAYALGQASAKTAFRGKFVQKHVIRPTNKQSGAFEMHIRTI